MFIWIVVSCVYCLLQLYLSEFKMSSVSLFKNLLCCVGVTLKTFKVFKHYVSQKHIMMIMLMVISIYQALTLCWIIQGDACFICIMSFIPYNDLMREGIITAPIYRGRNLGIESLYNFLNIHSLQGLELRFKSINFRFIKQPDFRAWFFSTYVEWAC